MEKLNIANTDISVKEYNGNRVVTFKDIDTVHKRSAGTARRNFNHNNQHFIEGEDYYKIQPNEIRTVGIKSPNGGIVLTESGYLMLVKSFTDELSWDVQRALVNSYFKGKQATPQYEQLSIEEISYKYVKNTYNGITVATIYDVAHCFGINYKAAYYVIRKVLAEHNDYELLTGAEIVKFKQENPRPKNMVSSLYIIYRSGFEKLEKYFNVNVEIPAMIEDKKSVQMPITKPKYVYVDIENSPELKEQLKIARKLINTADTLLSSMEVPTMEQKSFKCCAQTISDICAYNVVKIMDIRLKPYSVTDTYRK